MTDNFNQVFNMFSMKLSEYESISNLDELEQNKVKIVLKGYSENKKVLYKAKSLKENYSHWK